MDLTSPLAGSPARLRLAYTALSLGVIVLDQITKAAVVARIPLHTSIPLVEGLLELTHVKNFGAAFSLFATLEAPFRGVFLNTVAGLVFFAVLVYSLRSSLLATRLQTGLALILGGAVGNLVDRLRIGSVTDFVNVYLGSYLWPTFNVADSAITVGVVLLAWDIWKTPAHAEDRPSGSPAEV